MLQRLTAAIAAIAVAMTAAAPAQAHERRGHGYYERDYRDGGYRRDHRRDYRRDRHRDHDDNGDAVAAGVVGLVLGLAIGSLAAQSNERRRERCSDDYRRCDDGYDRRGYERGSAYEDDYGYAPPPPRASECTRRERQWDRYANRYVTVDVPC